MTDREFDRLVTKFRMRTRQGRHLRAEFYYQGHKIRTTYRSQGRKDNPFYHIAQQLALTPAQLRDAIRCTLSLDDYIALLRDKGLIAD